MDERNIIGLAIVAGVSVFFGIAFVVVAYAQARAPVSKATEFDVPGHEALLRLVGRAGRTATPLCPQGVIILGGRRFEGTTGGFFVEAGQWVVVTHLQGVVVYVQPKNRVERELESNVCG
jgi:membrane-bound ClpP family serine protease